MSDHDKTGVPMEFEDPSEERLWDAMSELPSATPSSQLRHTFYKSLESAIAPTAADKLRQWLGFSGNAGWVTAAASLVVGVLVGQLAHLPNGADQQAFESLEAQVAMLNRSLILDRLESASPSKRLRGVIDAVGVVETDTEITRALLRRAVDDRVHSVRSAAIDALGPQLTTPSVGDELMRLLEAAESPLVQLALVDLILRQGSASQIQQLLRLAEDGLLHPDLTDHVLSSVVRNPV